MLRIAIQFVFGLIVLAATPSFSQGQELSTEKVHLSDGVDLAIFRSEKTPKSNAAAVVLIPGGGWLTCDPNSVKVYCEHLAGMGFVAISTTYRVVPTYPKPANFDASDKRYATWPAQLDDVRSSIWWIRSNAERLGVEPSKVASIGFSAGGLLSAHLACADVKDPSGQWSCKVERSIVVGGPWDLKDVLEAHRTQRKSDAYNDPNSLGITMTLFGGIPETLVAGTCPSLEQAWQASPQRLIDKDVSPVLILHGTKDQLVPVFQATRAHQKIESLAKGRCILKLVEVGHEVSPEFYAPMIEFLGPLIK